MTEAWLADLTDARPAAWLAAEMVDLTGCPAVGPTVGQLEIRTADAMAVSLAAWMVAIVGFSKAVPTADRKGE